jgi:enamine deaminase RidA (YjgF/YER057c/UK114 family)
MAVQGGSAEERVNELGIELGSGPTPLGAYVEAVETGGLLFLSGMLPVVDHKPAFVGRIGKELGAEEGRAAARVAAVNVLAAARQKLGSLDKVTRVVRLSVFLATAGDFFDQPRVADGASELLRDVFGEERMSVRSVIGVASLPLGMPVELEVTMEVAELNAERSRLESAPFWILPE